MQCFFLRVFAAQFLGSQFSAAIQGIYIFMSPAEVVLRLVLDEGDRLIDEGFEEESGRVSLERGPDQIMKFQDFERSMSTCVNMVFVKADLSCHTTRTSWNILMTFFAVLR